MLFVDWSSQKQGYGRKLMEFWESDMKAQGYGMVLTSTQVDEDAQHFYRKLICNDLLSSVSYKKSPQTYI